MAESKPPSNRSRAKRLLTSASAGIILGIACQLAPAHWRMPCAIAVKLIALLFGGAT